MCQAMPSFIVLLVAWCSLTLTSADVYCFFLLLLLFSSSSCFGEVERKCGDDRILKKLLLLTPNRLSGQTKHSLSLSILLPLSHTPTHPRTYTHPHTHPFSALELATGCIPVRSAQYSTLPKKNNPLSSHCSLEATHCHSHSCVTAINHPSM